MRKEILSLVIVCLLTQSIFSAYNTSLARQLGYMSAIAYEKQSDIDNWKCSICGQHPVKNPSSFYSSAGGENQGFTAFSTTLNAIVIAFRGSANIDNWIIDFKAVPVSYPKCSGCIVHDGFYKGYLSLSSFVNRNVQNLKALYPSVPIYITGHSLGAALGIICASEIRDTFPIGEIYNYGQPRVGNQAFANYIAPKIPNTYRLIDYADIVPHLPPSALGFSHSNTQVWYQRGMQTYQLCAAEAKQCANSISVTQYSGADHSLDQYLKLKVGNFFNFEKLGKEGKIKFVEVSTLEEQYDELKKVIQFQMNDILDKAEQKQFQLEELKKVIEARKEIQSQI